MSKITYANKVALNENADIPNVNKVTDNDMNEIKTVVNNNDDELTTINTKLTNITGQILWTNSNPTQAISETINITLSSSNYDMIEIYYIQATSSTSLMYSNKILKRTSTKMRISTSDGANIYRGMTYLSDTSYRIDLPYGDVSLSSISSMVIPVYIIGYKTGLFN